MDWKKLALEQAALIEQLRARIAELEAKVAALKKNSSNSSKPPSSDIVKPPKTKNNGEKKKIGAQKGYKQHLHTPFDETHRHHRPTQLDACPTCGGNSFPPANHRKNINKSNSSTNRSSLRNFSNIGTGANAAGAITQPSCRRKSKKPGSSGRSSLRRMQGHRESILQAAWRRIPDDNGAINIAERLWNWQNEYFRFIDAAIPPTNNLAEQAVRRVVIDRKVTQGMRSDWGNRWHERFWSVLATCEQRGRNVMSFRQSCVESFLHGLAPPSLLRD
jgi:hypothetical protein